MDVVRAFEPIVKWAGELKEAADAAALIERAVATATGGRPGPVLISVPADVMDARRRLAGSARRGPCRAEHHAEPDPALVRKILHLLADARRPLILAGAGVLRAEAPTRWSASPRRCGCPSSRRGAAATSSPTTTRCTWA